MRHKTIAWVLLLFAHGSAALGSDLDIGIECASAPQDTVLCTVANSATEDIVLLISDGSLEGPVSGESYLFVPIGALRFESVLQYGPADRPLWQGEAYDPSVCITAERLGKAVVLSAGRELTLTVRVSEQEANRRLRDEDWRMKFKTVFTSRESLSNAVKKLGGEWIEAVSGVPPV